MSAAEMMASTDARRAPRDVARWVLDIEANAVRGVVDQLDDAFDRAVELLADCRGRAVCTGMGKSGLIMRKIAATLSSTGTPAHFLHPAEAIHGDLGVVVEGDVVVAASYSGTTEELLRLVELLGRIGAPLIAITGHPDSPLARHADAHLSAAIDHEACPLNLAPTASTTATLALGDALAMATLEARGFTPEDFARLHPGGQLGRQLLQVEGVMRTGDDLPRVRTDAPLTDSIYEMSRRGLGITAVVDGDAHLVGCLSDGDLRRLLERGDAQLDQPVAEVMRAAPKTIDRRALASAALHTLETHRITSLFVLADADGDRDDGGGGNPPRRLDGIVHLHDLWRLELF
ncbi:MAG: KpsF/GutQ family sugar-phosphate isomerase [Acidobacteriota bacterium]